MKAIRIVLAIALYLPAFAQSGLIRRGFVTDSSRPGGVNYYFTYETRLEPPSPPIAGSFGGGAITGNGEMHRIVTDDSRRMSFGYDLTVETLPQPNTYRLTFRPLTIPERDSHIFAGYTMLPLPGYPAPQTAHIGDTIALDLFTNPTTGQKIVEYIKFEDPKPQRQVHAVSGVARDFRVEDAELSLMEPHVSVNGVLLPATANFKGGIVGAATWIYIPNHGRYVMSLVPHPNLGLQKAGEVRGSTLSLNVASDAITLECNGPIAPGNAPYNLYVIYDGGWLPKDANARNSFLMGSKDSIESILRQ